MDNPDDYIRYLVLGGFIVGLMYSLLTLLRSLLALTWSSTMGEIMYAGIDTECDDESCQHTPVIRYKYQVNGREYQSDRFAFGYLPGFKFLAKGVYKKYKNHPSVRVYYNRHKPEIAVLIRGLRLFHVINISFFVFGLYFLQKA